MSWEFLEFGVGTLVGLASGIGVTLVQVNSSYDNEIRGKLRESVDDAVKEACEYFEKAGAISSNSMEYAISSLVGDVRLKPILGSQIFEHEFERLNSKLYLLSSKKPETLSESEIEQIISEILELGIKLKRVIDINSGKVRFWRKK